MISLELFCLEIAATGTIMENNMTIKIVSWKRFNLMN